MQRSRNALIIFAKAPVPGLAKTRMIPVLGAEGAARLQRELLLRTLDKLVPFAEWDTQLWCAPATNYPIFEKAQLGYGVTLHRQHGDDLGERMAQAFDEVLRAYESAIIVGTDCPLLDAAMMRQGFAALLAGADAVVAPAEDGGYAMLGLNSLQSRIFQEIDWGSERVMQQTRAAFAELNWNVEELPAVWDVDVPEDLARYHDYVSATMRKAPFRAESGFRD